MKNKRRNSIIYKMAVSFSLMTLIILLLLSGISYFFLSSQYNKNIKSSLINQFQSFKDELISDESTTAIEEQLSTLTNEWYLIFISTNRSYSYQWTDIPFIEKWFYKVWWWKSILFYTNTIKWKNIFLGRKMDDFEKTRNDYIMILIIINSVFLLVSVWLSLILSKKILKPITELSNYLLWYKFDNSTPKTLYQDWQFFEITILTKSFDTALHYVHQAIKKEKEFLQDASHELRTPLMWISSSVELLQNTSLTDQQKEKIAVINLLTNKLQKITNELLFLTRWESQVNAKKIIKLWDYIQTIINWYKENIKEKEINLVADLDDIYEVMVSEVHIQKLFSNLIDNAIKYTNKWWSINISLQNGVFSIQDTGIGMSKKFIPKLWNRFIRDEEAIKSNYEWVGLWVSIVYKILEIYGRRIQIESEQWKGTQICIYFDKKQL